jgi:hypothetical protein
MSLPVGFLQGLCMGVSYLRLKSSDTEDRANFHEGLPLYEKMCSVENLAYNGNAAASFGSVMLRPRRCSNPLS